jgi:hypothetical protein
MFDPQRRGATPELKAAVKSLIPYLERREADLKLRERARREADRRSFHLAIEAIACSHAGTNGLSHRPKQLLDFPCRHRPAEVITLHFIAIILAQKRHLIFRLYPLCDHSQIELLPERNHRCRHGAIIFVRYEIGDE